MPPSHWRLPALAVVTSLLCWGILYWKSLAALVHTWNTDASFSHCFFVPLLALFVVWRQRDTLAQIHPRPAYWGASLIAVGTLLWLMGVLGYVLVLQELAAVLLLQATVLTLLGWKASRTILFPLLALFLAIPFGESLVSPLQDFTALFLVKALRISGISVLLEDRVVTTPSGVWTVAEACSGMRYLMSSVVLGLFIAYLGFRTLRKRIYILLTFTLVPVVANGLRAYGIVLLAHLTNNRLARGVDHIIYGWIFFTAISFATIAVTLRWWDGGSTKLDVAAVVSPDEAAKPKGRYFAIATLICVAVLSLGPISQLRATRSSPLPTISTAPLQVSAPWGAIPGATQDSTPFAYEGRTGFVQRYSKGPRRVDFAVAYYAVQASGVSIVAPWNIVSHRRWIAGKQHLVTVIIDGREVQVIETVIRSGTSSRIVWNWYWIAGQFTGNATTVKYSQAKMRLFGDHRAAAVVSVSAGFEENKIEATGILQDFLQHLALDQALRAATGGR